MDKYEKNEDYMDSSFGHGIAVQPEGKSWIVKI